MFFDPAELGQKMNLKSPIRGSRILYYKQKNGTLQCRFSVSVGKKCKIPANAVNVFAKPLAKILQMVYSKYAGSPVVGTAVMY